LQEDIDQTKQERQKKKWVKMLKASGLIDCYNDVMKTLCTEGLPAEGNVYEFSAN